MRYDVNAHRPHAQDEPTDDGPATIRATHAQVDTHWTRILHYDIYTAEADDTMPDPAQDFGSNPGSETLDRGIRRRAPDRYSVDIFAAADDSGRQADSRDTGFPVTAVAILLGIYVVVCLAVAGLVHVLFPKNAAAAIHSGRSIPSGTLAASTLMAWPVPGSLRPSKMPRNLHEGAYPHVD